MAVRFRGAIVAGILDGIDRSSFEAVHVAESLMEKYGPLVYRAEVDRFDGLIIYWTDSVAFELGSSDEPRGHHFVTAICGYSGSGPIATARILEMFGFGRKDELLEQINFGGDHAYFTFSRQSSSTA